MKHQMLQLGGEAVVLTSSANHPAIHGSTQEKLSWVSRCCQLCSNLLAWSDISSVLHSVKLNGWEGTHTHTTVLQLFGFCPGQPGWASTGRNIHPLTLIMVINHLYLLSPSTTIHGIRSLNGWEGMFDFYARQHICYSTYMPWQFRLSVCPSVCLSVRRITRKLVNGFWRNFL